jgi:transposase
MHIQKIVKNKIIYYRLVKTERVNGKPRITWQKYLGRAEKINEVFENINKIQIHSKPFGSVAAILSIAEELNIEKIISKIIFDKNLKLSVYQHIIMQSVCRFNSSLSKSESINWFNDSILPFLWKKNFRSPQTIFNQFDKICNGVNDKIIDIEEELCNELLNKGVKPKNLIWDPTNFFTYIEKGENLTKKGNSKEKRYDKNLINLGLIVNEDNIPFMHVVYEGNEKESNIFTNIIDIIHSRLKKLKLNLDEITFIFDKGNNSKDNIPFIKEKFNFIGSLKPNQLKDLLDIPLSKFEYLYTNNKGNKISGYKTEAKIYEDKYTIVITYNEKSEIKQREKTLEAISKIKTKFEEIENNFKNKKKGKKTTLKGISSKINTFLHKQYSSMFDWDFNTKEQKITWVFKKEKFQEKEKSFGKNILFTDLNNISPEIIAKSYNSKNVVETDFKLLKNKIQIPIKPIYSRKDNRIKMHIFICILSLILYRYMQFKLKNLKLSDTKLEHELNNMRLAFIKQKNSKSIKTVIENMNKTQLEIYSKLDLGKYMPK